jgi:hypothetical protein
MNSAPVNSQKFPGALDNPFKDWPNGDLLIEEADRAFFAKYEPRFAPIFDWPELRALFIIYDNAAASARKRSRRAGFIAVVLGLSGLVISAIVPLAAPIWDESPAMALKIRAILGALAAILAAASVIIGYTHVLKGVAKMQWVTYRLWTERLRQLHFQLIVNNLPQVIRAVRDHEQLQTWFDIRQSSLDQFKHEYLRDSDYKVHHIEIDVSDEMPWLFDEWAEPGSIPGDSPELARFFEIMKQHRFGIQRRYAEKKMDEGWHSPETRTQWVLKLSDLLTAVLLAATVIIGVGSISVFQVGKDSTFLLVTGCIAAVSSSCIVAMRALKEGLLFSADAERYRWYLAAVNSVSRRFESADTQRKVHLCRELEVSHARFVM